MSSFGFGIDLALQQRRRASTGSIVLNALIFAPDPVSEAASNGSVVGTPSGFTSGSIRSLAADSTGGGFAIDVTTGQITVADTAKLDYAAAPNASITVRETLGAAGNSPRDTVFTIPLSGLALPAWSVLPGQAQQGQVLTGSDGTVIGGAVSSRQWLRNGAAISGANAATYTLQAADAGKTISFQVTAQNAKGRTATATTTGLAVSPITSLTILNTGVLPDGTDAAVPNGWVAMVTMPDDGTSTFDPTKITLTVADYGFDTSGALLQPGLGGPVRTIKGTAIVRKQYISGSSPASNTLRLNSVSGPTRTVYFALDQSIYASTVITGASAAVGHYGSAAAGPIASASNTSTLAYPKPRFMWFSMQMERAIGAAINVEAAAEHIHAMNGQQVACIKFQGFDAQTTPNSSAEVVAGSTSLSTLQTQGQIGEVYKAAISLINLTQGDQCRVNAKVCPWIGDASAVLDLASEGVAWPTAQAQTQLQFLNDKTAAYGGNIAYVRTTGTLAATSTNGVFAAQQSSLTDSQCYPTPQAAIQALQAANALSAGATGGSGQAVGKGHNDHSGSTVYLNNTTGSPVAFAIATTATLSAGKCWTDVRADPSNNAPVSINMTSANVGATSLLRFFVNITQAGGNFDAGATNTKLIAFDGNTITLSSGATALSYRFLRAAYRNVMFSGAIQAQNPFTPAGNTKMGVGLALGVIATGATSSWRCSAFAMAGCRFTYAQPYLVDPALVSNFESMDGAFLYNCLFLKMTNGMNWQAQAVSKGLTFMQCVLERVSSGPALQIAADGIAYATRNVSIQYLSLPGVDANCRMNIGYGGYQPGIPAEAVLRNSLICEYNSKADTYNNTGVAPLADQSGRTGSWKLRYFVDCQNLVLIRGDSNSGTGPDQSGGSVGSSGNWLGEVLPRGSAFNAGNVGFTDDKTGASGAGIGTYSLIGASNSAYSRISAAQQGLKYDIAGMLRRTDGSGAVGAYERS